MDQLPVEVTLRVVEVLEELGVPYFITGSLAISLYGVARSTLDTDLVAELQLEHVQILAGELADEFYADAGAISDAIRRHSSFNLIHLETMFKVDIFVPEPRPFKDSQFKRRTEEVVATDPKRTAYLSSAEDTVLVKLESYCAGGEVSDRQWEDVLGVLEIQEDELDRAYIQSWASKLGLEDLLSRAYTEAGLEK